MKNLLNCHSVGLHSFPISLENNLYTRVFYAEETHNLWKLDPLEIAVHPHHVNIEIEVLDGTIYNHNFSLERKDMEWNKYKWNSEILHGKGGFEYLGKQKIGLANVNRLTKRSKIKLEACQLHTISIMKGTKAVWKITETIPTCEYFPINYTNADLSNWSSEGLYIEVGDDIKKQYLQPYNIL